MDLDNDWTSKNLESLDVRALLKVLLVRRAGSRFSTGKLNGEAFKGEDGIGVRCIYNAGVEEDEIETAVGEHLEGVLAKDAPASLWGSVLFLVARSGSENADGGAGNGVAAPGFQFDR